MPNSIRSESLAEKALRIRDVCNRVGISRTHLYRLVSRGLFPAPIRLSERVSVWRESEVNGWLHQKFSSATLTGA